MENPLETAEERMVVPGRERGGDRGLIRIGRGLRVKRVGLLMAEEVTVVERSRW